jgi:hypothetical protein
MDVDYYITVSDHALEAESRQLPPSEYVTAVRAIPKEANGLERKYLEALQKNVTARKEYHALLQQNHTELGNSKQVRVREARLSEHIDLLRLKKRHEELRILGWYMTKLKQTDASKSDFLDFKKVQRHESFPVPSGYHHLENAGIEPKESVGMLVRQLEIAVIRAKHEADCERKLLREFEDVITPLDGHGIRGNRPRALAAARDELVSWMEGKLSDPTSNRTRAEDDAVEEERAATSISQVRSEILEQYDRYVEARKRMLELTSSITRFTQQLASIKEPPKLEKIPPVSYSQQPTNSSILPFIVTQIHYPRQVHQMQRHRANHLTALIASECNRTNAELSRLADESHLIPTYPLLAQHDRFKHASVAIASRGLAEPIVAGHESQMNKRIEAWAFAAGAATQATKDFVKGHLGRGEEAVEEGEDWLGRLRELVGDEALLVHNDKRDNEAGQDEEEDVWAIEADMDQQKRGKRITPDTKGPWAGLRGDLGLRKDP